LPSSTGSLYKHVQSLSSLLLLLLLLLLHGVDGMAGPEVSKALRSFETSRTVNPATESHPRPHTSKCRVRPPSVQICVA